MALEWKPDAKSPVPLYYQLREYLREGIANSDDRVLEGDKLKPEEAIAEAFGVSRATARHAIMDLTSEGLLVRRRSLGTFLVPVRRFEHWVDPLESLAERLESSQVSVSGKTICAGFLELAQGWPVKLFGGTRFFYLERTRIVDGVPIAADKSYFPPFVGEVLQGMDLDNLKIWRVMDTEIGVRLSHSDDHIRAVASTAYDSKLLEVPAHSPLLVLERVVYAEGGSPVEYTHSFFRGDSFEYRIRRDRQHSATSNVTFKSNEIPDER